MARLNGRLLAHPTDRPRGSTGAIEKACRKARSASPWRNSRSKLPDQRRVVEHPPVASSRPGTSRPSRPGRPGLAGLRPVPRRPDAAPPGRADPRRPRVRPPGRAPLGPSTLHVRIRGRRRSFSHSWYSSSGGGSGHSRETSRIRSASGRGSGIGRHSPTGPRRRPSATPTGSTAASRSNRKHPPVRQEDQAAVAHQPGRLVVQEGGDEVGVDWDEQVGAQAGGSPQAQSSRRRRARPDTLPASGGPGELEQEAAGDVVDAARRVESQPDRRP